MATTTPDSVSAKPASPGSGLRLAGWTGSDSLFAGFVLALALWLLAARSLEGLLTAERCNRSSYGELLQRYTQLGADLTLSQSRSAQDQYDQIDKELRAGTHLPWIKGTGYITLWERLHRAEESLIDHQPKDAVIAGALADEQRLSGSQLTNRLDLLGKLRAAVVALDHNALPLLALTADEAKALKGAGTQASATDPSEGEARSALRVVRNTLNRYQDERYAGFVASRNFIWMTATITGATAFTLLAIAMIKCEPRAIMAGAVLYLVSATTGLLARLRNEFGEEKDTKHTDDYGLGSARLFAAPLLSGLAGIGGVALLAGSSSVLFPGPRGVAMGMGDVFCINGTHDALVRIIEAAVFGLTPELLLGRLQELSSRAKNEIKTAGPSDGSRKP